MPTYHPQSGKLGQMLRTVERHQTYCMKMYYVTNHKYIIIYRIIDNIHPHSQVLKTYHKCK